MAKRKIQAVTDGEPAEKLAPLKKSRATEATKSNGAAQQSETIQIVAGSYDRVLHGLTATIEPSKETVEFADTFLFNAHASAIRSVALSPASAPAPGQAQKVFLASGSTDERINVYSLSAHPPSRRNQELLAKVAPRPILENRKNREVGALLHHGSSVTALRFPTRGKLLSASEDSTIAVTRTRDWSLLSTIKAPVPKAMGRPSGDTAPLGGTPSGVNDFAIHPSMKLMISVSKGERCMRLWNLVTGKKAGVLNFERDMLQEAGEGKHSTGEGRKVVWGRGGDGSDDDGADEFAVAFDRDVVVFGMDSTPRCRVMPSTARTKVHHVCYVEVGGDRDGGGARSLLAVSTEDGRVLFFSTRDEDLLPPGGPAGPQAKDDRFRTEPKLPVARLAGAVGGKAAGVSGRIKDFVAVRSSVTAAKLYVVAGSSDGRMRMWSVGADELDTTSGKTKDKSKGKGKKDVVDVVEAPVGKLLGTYETQNRITCMAAFAMIPRPEGAEESEDEDEETSDSDGEEDEE